MKKIFRFAILCQLALLSTIVAAQTPIIDLGIFNNPANSNKLEIRLKTTQDVVNGVLSAGVFTVRYPSSYGVNLSVVSSVYNYSLPVTGSDGTYNYFTVSFATNFTVNWTSGQEYLIATLQHSNNGVGNGIFELTTGETWTTTNNGDFYQELNGLEAQRMFYQPTASAPLPIELIQFDAKAQKDHTVKLDWKSSLEIGIAYFNVEHSTDGIQYKTIGQVVAKGGPNTPAAYTFDHKDPQDGVNYYRLQIVNAGGIFDYSPVRTARFDGGIAPFTLLPNPTSGPLDLLSDKLDQYESELYYQITDETGRLIQEDKLVDEKTHFDLSNYPAGSYYLNIRTTRERIKQFKLVVTPK